MEHLKENKLHCEVSQANISRLNSISMYTRFVPLDQILFGDKALCQEMYCKALVHPQRHILNAAHKTALAIFLSASNAKAVSDKLIRHRIHIIGNKNMEYYIMSYVSTEKERIYNNIDDIR